LNIEAVEAIIMTGSTPGVVVLPPTDPSTPVAVPFTCWFPVQLSPRFFATTKRAFHELQHSEEMQRLVIIRYTLSLLE